MTRAQSWKEALQDGLRYAVKQGFTLNEIAQYLTISDNRLSNFLSRGYLGGEVCRKLETWLSLHDCWWVEWMEGRAFPYLSADDDSFAELAGRTKSIELAQDLAARQSQLTDLIEAYERLYGQVTAEEARANRPGRRKHQ